MAGALGKSVLRAEDIPALTGSNRYTGDAWEPRAAHMAFVRSSEPHARITRVATEGVADLEGLIGVWTAEDLPELPLLPTASDPKRPALATQKVRFVGEPIAVVIAEDPRVAADAVAGIEVEYEPLPAVASVEAAVREDAPLLFEELGSNLLMNIPVEGLLEEQLQAAPRRARLRIVNQRCAAAPLETVACLADWTPQGLTLVATTQTPHVLRRYLCRAFDLPQNAVRVVAPDVGGGFGAKNVVYPEYLVAPLLSRTLGRPVKATQTRSESLIHMTHGRAHVHDVDVGFDETGRILVLRLRITQDLGSWPDPIGVSVVGTAMWSCVGCYDIPHVAVGARTVLTNTTPVAQYRGAGRPEAAFTIERIIDLVADEAGVDAVDVRRRNFISRDDFPYTTPTGFVYDSGDYHGALDELLRHVDYRRFKKEQEARRVAGDTNVLGIGFSTFVDLGGVGPSATMGALYLGGWESARVQVHPDGTVTIWTGLSPHGQGSATALAQIAADVLEMEPSAVSVVHGDTAQTPEGIGTFGSRGIAVGGEAVARAARSVLAKATRIAATLARVDVALLEFVGGEFRVMGDPGRSVDWTQVVAAAYSPMTLADAIEPGLEKTVFYEPSAYTCSFGAHACIVEVDRDTGATRILRYVAVDDAGRLVNPLLAEGQVHGGIAQGIGQALFEHVRYDDDGYPLTRDLDDYLLPTSDDVPGFETAFTETTTPVNSLGAKGIGESGSTGAPPAVINAIVDALSHLGIRHIDMPATPESVWLALEQVAGSR